MFPSRSDNRRAKHLTDFGKNDGLPNHNNKKYFISPMGNSDHESILVTVQGLCFNLESISEYSFFLFFFPPAMYIILPIHACYSFVLFCYLGGKKEEVRIRLSKPDWIKGKYTEIQYYLHNVHIVLKALPCV